MTLAFGNYDQSYPPEVLRGYVAPVLSGGAARSAPAEGDAAGARTDSEGEQQMSEPTTPPHDVGPESNAPEGAVPVDSTRVEPDGPAVVAVPADQLDEAAAGAESPTVRAPTARETEAETAGGDAVPIAAGSPSAADAGTRFTVSAGTPGSYDPEVPAGERPRNVTELRETARPLEDGPWLAGEYVLVGTTGKRAHWSGDEWHSGAAPATEAGTEVPEPDDGDEGDDR